MNLIKKLKSGDKPILIFICGMPGTRKSSVAVKLAAKLGFSSIIGVDQIRSLMQMFDDNPYLQGKSTDRWKLLGDKTNQHLIQGFLEQAKALKRGVMTVLEENISIGENTIIEGVHLIPSLYQNINEAQVFYFLLTAKSYQHHLKLLDKKFSRRHNKQPAWSQQKIELTHKIQNYLLKVAQTYPLKILEVTTPKKTCQEIINYIGLKL